MISVDVGIVGGGPAGLAAALYASRAGLSAVVFEPREAPIDKACGEGVMPGGLDRLDDLGVRPRGRPFVGIRYLDGRSADCVAEGDFPGRFGRGIRRLELHRAMSERLANTSVQVIRRRVRDIEFSDDRVVVGDVAARYLVGADGLHSRVRKEVGLEPNSRTSSRFGVRRHYAIAPWTDRVEVYWSEVGEAYVTPVSDDVVGVALLYEPPGRFDDLLHHFPVLVDRLGEAAPASDDRGAGPFGCRAARPVDGRVLLVGDAAGYLDPLTGEGVQLGIATAEASIAAIANGTPGRYVHDWARVVRSYWWMTRAVLTVTRPRVAQRPMIRALDRLPRVFDGILAVMAG